MTPTTSPGTQRLKSAVPRDAGLDAVASPFDWTESQSNWVRIVLKAREYFDHRRGVGGALSQGEGDAAQFNDLAEIAGLIGKGSSLARIRQWLGEPEVRKHSDSRRIHHLLTIIDELEIF